MIHTILPFFIYQLYFNAFGFDFVMSLSLIKFLNFFLRNVANTFNLTFIFIFCTHWVFHFGRHQIFNYIFTSTATRIALPSIQAIGRSWLSANAIDIIIEIKAETISIFSIKSFSALKNNFQNPVGCCFSLFIIYIKLYKFLL